MSKIKLCESTFTAVENYSDDVNYKALALEAVKELNTLIDNNLRSIGIIEGLIDMRSVFVAKESFSESDRQLIKINTQMALAGTGLPNCVLFPSLESMTPSLAIEAIDENLKKAVTATGNNNVSIIKAFLLFLQKILFALRSSKGKIKAVKAELDRFKTSSITNVSNLEVKNRSIFVKDQKLITDIIDLVKEFELLDKFFERTLQAIINNVKILEEGYGQLQLLRDILKINETSIKLFKDIEVSVDKIIKESDFIKKTNFNNSEIFVNPSIIGESTLEISRPIKSTYDSDSVKDIRKVVENFNVDLTEKSVSIHNKKTINLSKVSVKDLEDMVASIEKTLNHFEKNAKYIDRIYNNINNKIGRNIENLFNQFNEGSIGDAVSKLAKSIIFEIVLPLKILAVNSRVSIGVVEKLYWMAIERTDEGLAFMNEAIHKANWE